MFFYLLGCCLVDALEEIVRTMGSKYWKFDADSCEIKMVGVTQVPPKGSEHNIECKCNNDNDSDCHIVKMYSSLMSLNFGLFCTHILSSLEKSLNYDNLIRY